MVYQLLLCLLRGLALGEFLYNFDKVALEILGSAGWGCTLPGRVFVEYGLYSVLCATAVPERTGNEEEARETAEVRPRGPRSASLKLSGVGGAPEGMPGA